MKDKTNKSEKTEPVEKDKGRLEVLQRIEEYEKKQWWSKDVENDPPTIPLLPENTDYYRKKLKNKILLKTVNIYARHFINKMIRTKQLIIKEVIGMENYLEHKNEGCILTCNHFNAFDNFAVYKVIEKNVRKKELYRVIREGNFTSFPGLYGLFFRHCNTLPLSSNIHCMKLFMEAVSFYLKRGEKILIYPEQGMWWNYRKPRPMVNGAFRFAAQNKAPVIPFFITMNDSDIIGADGFPVQEYTVHISKAIYPKPELNLHENCEYLKEENYRIWKEIYETTYGIPLQYATE